MIIPRRISALTSTTRTCRPNAVPKNRPQFSGPWSFSASGTINGNATVSGSLFLTGSGIVAGLGTPGVVSSPGLAFFSGGGAARRYDALIESVGGSTTVDGQAVLNIRAAEVRVNGGTLTFFGHAPPGSQPPTPATLADVVAVLRAYGLCA
jgi:hypothetical protein